MRKEVQSWGWEVKEAEIVVDNIEVRLIQSFCI